MTHSTDQVTAHISQDNVVSWVPLARALTDSYQSCVDGRDPDAVLGTPGGDAGEFLLALAVIEKITGSELSDAEVSRLFDRYLAHFGRFYMHTDAHAMHVLADALANTTDFADVGGNSEATEALVRSPGDRAGALLPHLIVANHIGCGHLKLITKFPEDYGVRRALTGAFIQTVFKALWNGADVHYVVLQGGHAEGAVVQVNSGKKVHAYTSVPLVAPCKGDSQIFVNHPAEVGWLRGQLAAFLAESASVLEGTDVDAFVASINELAGVQLGHTLHHLADGLPIYQASVTEDGSVSVSG